MRQIVIDELSPLEHDNIDSYLKRSLKRGPMLGVYWLEFPSDMLSEIQQRHAEHAPFYCAVELTRDTVCFELLVRSGSNLHCSCIAYASARQRQFVLDFIDKMLDQELIAA
ncbi:MAG: hypothetical protein CSB32_01000 [Desulfobacterales bacterium]|nr:MAG: hypothetical protein CSB32_01000 [Desulfobacterales bacterium]